MLRNVILLTDIFGKVEKDGKKRGFTLVELMVVILIVGVLVCFFTLAMAGNRIAKSKAMMEITTKSSISVKPATFLVFGLCAVMVGGKIILEKKKYNSKIIETRVEIVS